MYMEKLKELREGKGMSQRQLGDLFGVAEATISNYETGKREPSFETLCGMADLFDCTLDMLVRGKEKTRSKERVKEDLRSMFNSMSTAELNYVSALVTLTLSDRELQAAQGSAGQE